MSYKTLKCSIVVLMLIPWMGFAEVKSPTEVKSDTDRLENLLIWKLTEELDLNSKDEIQFSNHIKKLGSEKRKIQNEISLLVEKMKSDSSLLKKYKSLQRDLTKNAEAEISGLEKILGAERTSKYIFFKSEILKRIANEISKPQGK